MNRKLKTKTGYIKRVEWAAVSGKHCTNLEQALRSILKSPENKREWRPAQDSQIRRVIVQIDDKHGFVAGRLVEFEIGKKPEVLQKSKIKQEASKIIPVKIADAPQGYENEVLNDSLFFVVKGDFVHLMQSVALKSSALEDHLNWILPGSTSGWSAGNILLANHIPQNVPEKIQRIGVEELKIGVEMSELFDQDVPDGIGTVDVIEGILGNLALTNTWSTSISQKFRGERFGGIKASVSVSLVKASGERALNLLNALALGMRHDASGVTLTLKDGEKITSKELVKTGKFDVEYFDGNPAVTQIYTGLSKLA